MSECPRVWEPTGAGWASREPDGEDIAKHRLMRQWAHRQITYKDVLKSLGYVSDDDVAEAA